MAWRAVAHPAERPPDTRPRPAGGNQDAPIEIDGRLRNNEAAFGPRTAKTGVPHGRSTDAAVLWVDSGASQ